MEIKTPFIWPDEAVVPQLWPLGLRLVREYGNLYLAIVDENGGIAISGRVLQIHRNGSIIRCGGVSEEAAERAGLKLSNGRVHVEGIVE